MLAPILPMLMIAPGTAALACSYVTFVWEPASDADPPYYSIWPGGKEGWIDRSGRRIRSRPPQPDTAANALVPFQHGDGVYGYSRSGDTVIPARYLDARQFHEARARVVLQGPCVPAGGGMCGAPALLPPSAVPRSVKPLDVQSRRWRPSAPPCRYTFIDTTGEVAGPATFDEAADFREGLAAVRLGDVWGYADKGLSIVITPRFQWASTFSESLAAVRTADGYSYIDRTGAVVIAGPFAGVGTFHDRLAAVYGKQGAWYIDNTGRRAVPGVYAHAGRFFHGRANVQFRDGTLAYIDRAGRAVYRWKP